jgi:hypothetical protein
VSKRKSRKKGSSLVGLFCDGNVAHEIPHEVKLECRLCGFVGHVYAFTPAPNPRHDVRCSECGTTQVDTSRVNRFLEGRYGFGDNNIKEGTDPNDPDLGE